MKTIVKIILAALLLGCLNRMPDNYYQFVRFSCFVGFGAIAYFESKTKNIISYVGIFLAVAGAILFNPFDKLTFKRYVWQDIDVWVAVSLGAWIIIDLVYLFNKKLKRSVTSIGYSAKRGTINTINFIGGITFKEVVFMIFLFLFFYAIAHILYFK